MMGIKDGRGIIVGVAVALTTLAGLGAGYLTWGWERDFFAFHDPAKLPDTPQNKLIQYGLEIVINTSQVIGPLAADPAMRFAANGLTCANCHLNGGLQKYAAPYVSTFASFPMMVSDSVETLADRLNGCMTHSMNGKPLPVDGREMQALIAYIQYLGVGTPEGVRLPGMGLLALKPAAETPDAGRGQTVFASTCAKCHGVNGQGQAATPPGVGYSIPPLWGDNSFNATAGMATLEMASAFVHANMPRGITWQVPLLSEQQAWDVAAFMIAQPRPPGPQANAAPAKPAPAAAPTAPAP